VCAHVWGRVRRHLYICMFAYRFDCMCVFVRVCVCVCSGAVKKRVSFCASLRFVCEFGFGHNSATSFEATLCSAADVFLQASEFVFVCVLLRDAVKFVRASALVRAFDFVFVFLHVSMCV